MSTTQIGSVPIKAVPLTPVAADELLSDLNAGLIPEDQKQDSLQRLDAYRREREQAGLPIFEPKGPSAQTRRYYDGAYSSGIDGLQRFIEGQPDGKQKWAGLNQALEFSLDRNEDLAASVNQAFATDVLNLESSKIDDGTWPFYRSQISTMFGGSEKATDAELFGLIGQHQEVQKRKGKIFQELAVSAMESAASGDEWYSKMMAKATPFLGDGADQIEWNAENLIEIQKIWKGAHARANQVIARRQAAIGGVAESAPALAEMENFWSFLDPQAWVDHTQINQKIFDLGETFQTDEEMQLAALALVSQLRQKLGGAGVDDPHGSGFEEWVERVNRVIAGTGKRAWQWPGRISRDYLLEADEMWTFTSKEKLAELARDNPRDLYNHFFDKVSFSRKLDPVETEMIRDAMTRIKRGDDFRDFIQEAWENDVVALDWMQDSGFLGEIAETSANIVGSIATFAVPGGLIANGMAMAEDERARLEHLAPDMDPRTAAATSVAVGATNALLEKLQIMGFMGKLPVTNRLMEKFGIQMRNRATRWAAGVSVTTATGMTQEFFQQMSPALYESLVDGLSQDIEIQVPWGEDLAAFKEVAPSLLVSMALVTAITHGVGTAADWRGARIDRLMKDGLFLRAAGLINEADIDAIKGATTLEQAIERYRNAEKNPESPQAREAQLSMEILEMEEAAALEEGRDVNVSRTKQGTWMVRGADGKTVEVSSIEDVLEIMDAAQKDELEKEVNSTPAAKPGEVESLASALAAEPLNEEQIAAGKALDILELEGRIERERQEGGDVADMEAEVSAMRDDNPGAATSGRELAVQSLESFGLMVDESAADSNVVGVTESLPSELISAFQDAGFNYQPGTGFVLEDNDLNPEDAYRAAARNTLAIASDLNTQGRRGVSNLDSTPALTDQNPGARAVSVVDVMGSLTGVIRALGSRGQVRVGRLRHNGNIGEAWLNRRLARVRRANDYKTAAHEVAHIMETLLFPGARRGQVWGNKSGAPKAAVKELVALGKMEYPNSAPPGGHASEGFAEWFRIYADDAALAQQMAPQFTAWFEQNIRRQNPALDGAIQAVQETATRYRTQGARNRGLQDRYDALALRNRAEKLKAAVSPSQMIRLWVDQAYPLARFVEDAAAEVGHPIAPEDDPYYTLSARRMTADAVAERFIDYTVTDYAGNPLIASDGKPLSLRRIFEPLAGKHTEFSLYLWAQRSMAMLTDPNGPREPGMTLDDAAQISNELETPEFQQAAALFYEWQDAVLDYAAEASPTFAEAVATIRQRDPGFYVPLRREFEAWNEAFANLAPNAASGRLSQRLMGSGRRVKNPIESAINNAKAIIQAAHQRQVLDQIIDLAESHPELGVYATEVLPSQQPAAVRGLADVLAEAEKAIRAAGGTSNFDVQGVDANLEFLTFFAPVLRADTFGEIPVVPIYKDGKIRMYEIAPALYEAMVDLQPFRLPGLFDFFVAGPARTFRAGTTALNVGFQLAMNPLRDLRTLQLNSQASANSAKLAFLWMQSMGEMVLHTTTGALSHLTNGKVKQYTNHYIEMYHSLGTQMAQQLRQDSDVTRRRGRTLFHGWNMATLSSGWGALQAGKDFAGAGWDAFLEVIQFPENASRLAEFKAVAKDVGWIPGSMMNLDQATQLLLAAKQATTDFTQGGKLAKFYNQMTPFFNASIQGTNAHIRAYRRNPAKFIRRGMQGAALALLLWWQNKDKEWWKMMGAKERYLFSYFEVPSALTDGRRQIIRIPRAFEADGLFMALSESLFDAAWTRATNDGDELARNQITDWMKVFLTNTIPFGDLLYFEMTDDLPTFLKVPAEQLANRDFFWDRPIVPRDEFGEVFPDEQVGPYTTRAAVEIGKLTGLSPRRIDAAINGMFGTTGEDALAILGRGDPSLGEVPAEQQFEPSDIPVFGKLFKRNAFPSHPVTVEAFYDRLEWSKMNQRSQREKETEDERQLRLQLEDAYRAIKFLGDVQRVAWSVDERRQLNELRAEMAGEAVRYFDAKEKARAKFNFWEAQSKRLSKTGDPEALEAIKESLGEGKAEE